MLTASFSQIENSSDPLKKIDTDVELKPEFFERGKELIIEAKNVHANIQLFYNEPYVVANFQVEADVVAPSTRSLKPVKLHEKFSFVENYSLTEPTQEELDDNGMIVKVDNDQIDLQTAIEDNILLHLPTTLLTKEERDDDVYPEGSGWNVISEDKYNEELSHRENPAFAKLKKLLPDEDKK